MTKTSSNQIQRRPRKARKAGSTPSLDDDGRHKVLHNYHDHAHVTFTFEAETEVQDQGVDKRKGPRGGVTVPFPTKLHVMLSKVDDDGLTDIVSWQPHGRCFVVHKPKEFVSRIMPTYFRQSKLTSFQRQLNLYEFARITTGRDRGGYYHELFLRHKLFLCQRMSRIRIKGTGIKGKASPETEPDFYTMPWVEMGDESKELNRELETQVVEAMRDEHKAVEPIERRNDERQVGGSKKKQDTPRMKHVYTDGAYSSPRISPEALPPFALVTPDSRSAKKQLPVSPSFDIKINSTGDKTFCDNPTKTGEQQRLINLFPPPLMSLDSEDSEDASIGGPHSGDEIDFEGQHFHYIDSFLAQPPPCSFTLGPRKNASVNYFDGVTALSPPRILPSLSESSLSIAQSLREPILTPSSSSSSLSVMLRQAEDLEINPDTIFSEKVFDEEWAIGGDDLDIEAEFSLLEG